MLPCYKTKLLTNWKIQLTNTKPGKKKSLFINARENSLRNSLRAFSNSMLNSAHCTLTGNSYICT